MLLSRDDVTRTGAWIASVQLPTGAIPWFVGGHLDPWDHVQSAMGLAVAGFEAEALAAFSWLRDAQRPDGTWAATYWPGPHTDRDDNAPEEQRSDANFAAYVATGLHHAHLLGIDVSPFVPMAERALAAVLEFRRPDGAFTWSRDVDGSFSVEALVTGNSSIAASLRHAGAWLGERAEWTEAVAGVEAAFRREEEVFTPKPQFSMDWYYPVLCHVVPDDVAQARIDAGWDTFVVPDLGARCVTPNPWVTGAETCELVLALESIGRRDEALQLFADMQHLRDPDGSYWTGYVYDDEVRWPVEQSTWTAATVLLAWDALTRSTPAATLFHHPTSP